MIQYLLIYYDGNETKAKLVERPEEWRPSGCRVEAWGLTAEDDITAIIALPRVGDNETGVYHKFEAEIDLDLNGVTLVVTIS